MSANTLEQRITDYLSGGGLFNPELANHHAVRDLLIECRAALASRDGEAVAQIVSSGPANMPLLQWLSADHSFRAPIGSRLFAAPPATRHPLMDEQINALFQWGSGQSFRDFARAIERAHGIGVSQPPVQHTGDANG